MYFDEITVQDCDNHGLYANDDSYPSIEDSTFQDNADNGIYVYALSDAGTPSFTGNTLTNNGDYPIRLEAGTISELSDDSTYTGNGTDYVVVDGGELDSSAETFRALDVDYLVQGDVTLSGTVDIESGVTLYIDNGVRWTLEGTLTVSGTSSDEVLFTSAQSTPAAGDWEGLRTQTSSAVLSMEYATVEYGGASMNGTIYCYRASSITLDNVAVDYSDSYGLYYYSSLCSSSKWTLSSMSYTGNTYGEKNW